MTYNIRGIMHLRIDARYYVDFTVFQDQKWERPGVCSVKKLSRLQDDPPIPFRVW